MKYEAILIIGTGPNMSSGFVVALAFLIGSLAPAQNNPVPLTNQRLAPTAYTPTFKLNANGAAGPTTPKVQAKILDAYGRLPLRFEANRGQADAQVKFLSRTREYAIYLAQDEIVLALGGKLDAPKAEIEGTHHRAKPGTPSPGTGVLRMKLHNANPTATVTGLDKLPGTSNYFIGNNPTKWRTKVSNYARVQYESIYSGIDLVYHGNQRQIEYDFIVAPGADPRRIVFDVRGAKQILRDDRGDLVFKVGEREVRWHKPVVYQKGKQNNAPRKIAAEYAITDKKRVGFALAEYDATKPLYIDPVIYSTYLGGGAADAGSGIAVDSSGNVYVTGYTESIDFPTTPGTFQPTCNAGSNCSQFGDVFVTKINAAGTGLVYSTYLGGSAVDSGAGIAVDSGGNAYVTGFTNSPDFPTSPGAYQTSGNGGAFVTKIDPTGSTLVYSTYLGGTTGSAAAFSIALDNTGDAYVTGFTAAAPHVFDDFPTTPGAFQTGCGDLGCDFVTKFNSTGTALVYSTYLGYEMNVGSGIAVDSSGSAYVTGSTPNGFPTTPGAFQTTMNGLSAAFVTKFNSTGTGLVYSTYLGNNYTGASAITVDSSGNAYVTGIAGADFPSTPGAFQTTCSGNYYECTSAFVTKINPAGSALVYSTFVGGSDAKGNSDHGNSIAVDNSGNAFVIGTTLTSIPITPGAFQTNFGGVSDAFVIEVDPSGSALYYASYLGGSASDSGNGIALDSSNNAYITGQTSSADFPTTTGAFQTTCNGGSACSQYSDAFVTKINFNPSVAVNLVPPTLIFGDQIVGSSSGPVNLTLTSTGIGLPLSITSIQVTGPNSADFAKMNNCPSSLPSTANCTITVTFTPTGGGTRTASVTITDNAVNSPQTIPLSGVGQDFSLALSGASSVTVSPGQIANYTISITPSGGFSQIVAFSCSGAPQQSSCFLAPSSVSLNGSASTLNVTLMTVGSVASFVLPSGIGPLSGSRIPFWLLLSGLAMLGLICFWSCSRKGRKRVLYRFVLAFLLSTGANLLACGSGGSKQNGGTPAGTYNIIVTGSFSSSANTLTHNTKLTLIVR